METGLIPAGCSAVSLPEITASTAELALQSIRIVKVTNPFQPDAGGAHSVPYLENQSVAAAVAGIGLEPEQFSISINGGPVEDAAIWRTAVTPGCSVVLFPRAAGGGWRSTLAMVAGLVAMVAAAAILFYLCPILAPWLSSAIVAGAGMLGSALASWALAPGQPSAAQWSATYDPTGPKGLAQPGVPVPKGYGIVGWCGNAVSSYVNFDGKDAYINVLNCYGWGPAVKLGSPLINLKPIKSFQNCGYQTRLGTNSQTPLDGFDKTVNGYPQEINLLVSGGAVVVPGTGTDVQGLEVTVKFPAGLYRVTNKGNYVPLKFIYRIQVSPHGMNDWTAPLFPKDTETIAITHMDGSQTWPNWVVMPTDRFAGSGVVYDEDVSGTGHTPGDSWTATQTVTVVNADSSHSTSSATFKGEWQPCDPNMNQVRVLNWWEGYRVVQNDTLSAFFDTVSIYGLAAGQWDVKVTKIGYCQDNTTSPVYADSSDAKHVEDGWLWNVNEVTWSNLSYPNMILLGVKALATSQMSGAGIQLQTVIQHDIGVDTVLPAALSGFGHDNPAIVAYDVLTNPTYGMGVSASLIDVPAFVAWAQFNDELVTNQDGTTARRHVFAGVFDQPSDAWKTLQTIGNMSRASVIPIGMRYTVVIDAPADPVQLFTVGNMKRDSFQEQWLSLDDRCTLIEVDFADAARNYRMDLPVSVMTEADINSGLQPRVTRTKLIGCTSRDQAWRWAYFQLLSTKLTLRTIQFSAALEAVCCRRGSVIAVQTDVTQWAAGGRILAGSTLSTLNIDRNDLTFALASGYTVSVQHPVIQRGTATVLSVSGLIVTMTAALPAGRILKAVGPDGKEYTVTGASGSAITVASSAGTLAAGLAVTLYDVNVVEQLQVTACAPAGTGAALTVFGSFQAVPTPDCAWTYGQSAGAQPAKLFRVGNIRKSGNFDLEISAAEYNAAIYEDVIPNYGEIVGVPDSTPAILNLSLTEQFQNGTLAGNTDSALVAVGWQNGNTAVGGQVQIQAQGGSWNTLGNIQGQGCTFVGYVGKTYNVKVIGFDWQGNLLGDPVSASITIVAATSAPANVTGFGGVASSTGQLLTWNVVPGANHYEIRWALQVPPAKWDGATVMWTGSVPTWTDTTVRGGYYMIVAVSSLATGSVESLAPAVWQSPAMPTDVTAGTGPMVATITTWFNETGSDTSAQLAGGVNGTVSISGGAPVAIPALSFSQSNTVTVASSVYAFLCLGSDLTWRTYWGGVLTAGVPDDSLVSARITAGDLVFLAVWGFAVAGPPGTPLSYVGGGVSIYSN